MAWEKLGTASVASTVANTSWKELGRATLSSTGDTITTGTFTAKDNIMFLTHYTGTATANHRFGNGTIDTGSNYAHRYSTNGGADSTGTSQSNGIRTGYGTTNEHGFIVGSITNQASYEKLLISHLVHDNGSTGAGNAPQRRETVGKWANTSNQINIAQVNNSDSGSGDFAVGSEIVVLGCDNDEADSGSNFWQELASVELSSTVDEINSGTFTAKKYLWIQLNAIASGSISGSDLQFNGDTGANYARRYSTNGAADATETSSTQIGGIGTGTGNSFVNWFVVNKSDKEKLVICEGMYGSSGVSNAYNRREIVGKWSNTSSQITSIKVKENTTGGWTNGTTLKVYGAD